MASECAPDYSRAIYFIDVNGALRESLPDENGKYDDETELWRDSQVSSGWMGAAYRAYKDVDLPKAVATEVVCVHSDVDEEKEPEVTAPVCSDAPMAECQSRSRSRSRGRKTKQQ
jgi:hypothetical protein